MRPGRTPRVLVVDDEESIRVALERALRLEGFSVGLAVDGADALAQMESESHDIVVLDVAMPGMSGVRVTERLRERGERVPVCMLSARDEVADRVAGLRAGADDYLVKPFALQELVARLHALLRRTPEGDPAPLAVGDLTVDPGRRTVHRGTRPVTLTGREFDLLEALARHPSIVLSRAQLLEQVWGYDFEVDGNVVDVFVSYLRRKLESGGEPRMLHTVRGVGFSLRP